MIQELIDLDRGAGISINASVVPDHLRHLIHLVARWTFV